MTKRIFNKITEISEMLFLVEKGFSKLETWEDIEKTFPLGKAVSINGSINICRIKTSNHIRFKTIIPPGVSFDEHWHDFTEKCMVVSGELYCKKINQTWRAGEVATFGPFIQHIPCNLGKSDLHLIVDFYRE